MRRHIGVALAFALFLVGVSGGQAEARKPRQSFPDLKISAISAPSSTSPGKTIAVSSSILNQGKATSVAFSMSYYLSTKTSKTSSSPLLRVQNVGSLPAGASVAITTSLAIPPATSPGTFYVVGLADSNAVVMESSELNNSASSGAISVTDSTPPTISAITSSGVTGSSATITWKTDEPGSSQVAYGTTTAYGSVTALATSMVTSHNVTLSSLTAGSVYHFRVHSKDSVGNAALSGDFTFTTASPTASAITGPAYYVATTGSDANPGSEAQPFGTISHGVSVLMPGDTLYVKSGTYAETLIHSIPPGTSWDSPVRVAAYPGHTVTLRPNVGAEFVLRFIGPQAYIIVEGFILDAANVTYDAVKITGGGAGPAHHIRLIRCEVKNAPGQGVLITQFADSNEFINVNVHDNGTTGYDHGLYISTSQNVVEGSAIHHNSGYGVHIYNGYAGQRADSNIVRSNRIFDNGWVEGDAGIILGSGDGNTAYNNLVWNNYEGIRVAYGTPSNTGVYNNTVYGNSTYSIAVLAGSNNTLVQNNVFYVSGWSDIYDIGTGSVISHNLAGTDPQLVNAAAGDFHLRLGSLAIDAGITISSVTTDIAGTLRPQGLASDLGAFELVP